jgi:hypothetical protein
LRKGTTLRVMVASRPKVSFWPGGSTSPGNYGYHHVNGSSGDQMGQRWHQSSRRVFP